MKHITTLIALALTLGTLVPLAAQTKMTAKEKRTQTRQERKIAQQKVKEQLYQDAVRALENNTFVLEADRLIFKRGRSVSVSSVKNFISMANKKATVQVSFDTPRPLQNGLGGFTVEGNVSDIRGFFEPCTRHSSRFHTTAHSLNFPLAIAAKHTPPLQKAYPKEPLTKATESLYMFSYFSFILIMTLQNQKGGITIRNKLSFPFANYPDVKPVLTDYHSK